MEARVKKFIFAVLTVAVCWCYSPPAVPAEENEVVITPEQWNSATDPASPGRNWQRVDEGPMPAPGEKEAPKTAKKGILRPGGGSLSNATDASFDAQVMRSPEPVLVEFWRPGCGHCAKMEGAVKELAGSVKVVRVNTDENVKSPARFGVKGVPTFFLFKDGKMAGNAVGEMSEEQLIKKLGL